VNDERESGDGCELDCPRCGTCEAVVVLPYGGGWVGSRTAAGCVSCGDVWKVVLTQGFQARIRSSKQRG